MAKQRIDSFLMLLGWATIEAILFSVAGWGTSLSFLPILAWFILLFILPMRFWLEHRVKGGTYSHLVLYGLLWIPVSIYATGVVKSICVARSTLLYPLTQLLNHQNVCALASPEEVAMWTLGVYVIGGVLLTSTIDFQGKSEIQTSPADKWFLSLDLNAHLLGILSILVICLVPVILYMPQANSVIGIGLGVSTAYLVITHRYRHLIGLIASVLWAFVTIDVLLRSFLAGVCVIVPFIPILAWVNTACDLHRSLQPVNSSMLIVTMVSSAIAYLVLFFASRLRQRTS